MNTENFVLEICQKHMGHCVVDYTVLFPSITRWEISIDDEECRCRGWCKSNMVFDFTAHFKEKQYNIYLVFCQGENNAVQFWQWKNREGVVFFEQSICQNELYCRSRGFLTNNVPVVTNCDCALRATNNQLSFEAVCDENNKITDFKISRKLK